MRSRVVRLLPDPVKLAPPGECYSPQRRRERRASAEKTQRDAGWCHVRRDLPSTTSARCACHQEQPVNPTPSCDLVYVFSALPLLPLRSLRLCGERHSGVGIEAPR